MPQLITNLLWQPMGAEDNADFLLDSFCTPIYNGGLCATLRDIGRLGQMLVDNGKVGPRQVVDEEFLRDSRTAKPHLDIGNMFYGNAWPNIAYHNTFFIDPKRPQATWNFGAFGNLLYVNPANRTVGVLLSAWESPHRNVMRWIDVVQTLTDDAAAR